jgi:PqqD family protein of HPr-rel-A system
MRWHTVPRETLSLRTFDDELVVRNGATGSTHLLQPLAAEALALLLEARDGMTAAELAARLGDDAEDGAAGIAAMEDLLSEFKRLGLAEPID